MPPPLSPQILIIFHTIVLDHTVCHDLDQKSYFQGQGQCTHSQNLCPGHYSFHPSWNSIFHTAFVHDPGMCSDLAARAYLQGQGYSAQITKICNPYSNVGSIYLFHTIVAQRMYHDLDPGYISKRKRKRSDSVLWQKPLHPQKNPKSNMTTKKKQRKTAITRLLRTDLGQSVGVMTATQLLWLNRFMGSQPSH